MSSTHCFYILEVAKMKIGHIISKLRYDKGYSQIEMAEKLGVTKGAVGMWETDKRKPDYDILIKIADLFDVTTDYLLSHSVSTEYTEEPIIENTYETDEITLRMVNTFKMLDEDYKDILIGEAKKLLKQQQLEEKRETSPPTAKAT